MDVKRVDENMYRIELLDEEEVVISVWAHNSHIDNEEVIDEWLSKAIEYHKPPKSTPQTDTEHKDEHCSI